METNDILVKWVGNLEVNATSEIYNNEKLDTKIEIDGGLLCVVAGNQREKFLKEFQELVNKYRI